MNKSLFARWRSSFLTGLAVVFPGVITLAVVKWLFGTVASLTDILLFFLPRGLTHDNDGTGPMRWCWSLLAFVVAVGLVSGVGVLTRYYMGKRMIAWLDTTMLRVPLMNKIYGTLKQVNEAFTSGKRSSFKTVVLVQYPRPGVYSMGFITSEQHDEIWEKTKEKTVCVFIPTTPIPTSGFLVLVPENEIIKLDMSVADGIKYIISLGAISHEYTPPGAK